MRLLILTQKIDINDDVLGFMHRWVEEFAKHCEKLTVIALGVGEYNLPENVKVLSLGKEKFSHNSHRFRRLALFYKYIWQERKNYDAVFVHMNPIYIVLGGAVWRVLGKRVGLWYTHKAVDWKLRIAEKLADKIFTASKESFRLPSKKVVITGHGIDTIAFRPKSQIPNPKSQNFKIITVGRISPVKNMKVLIEVAEILRNKNFDFEIKIAGAPILKHDKIYFEELKNVIKGKKLGNKIIFTGSIPYKNIAEFYQEGDLFVNLSDTGSIDKAVLEAMACGLKILVSNDAFENILPEKYFTNKNSGEIADKIITLSKTAEDPSLREHIVKNHNLENLIDKIINFLKNGK